LTKNLVPGVYSGFGMFPKSEKPYMCAVSIGYNPTFEIPEMVVEAYIMHDFEGQSLYGEELSLQLKSFMRAETLFPTFDDLILAIHCDVEAAKDYLSQYVSN
jgi:riboflavin kinase/FMN adenylyltransferase